MSFHISSQPSPDGTQFTDVAKTVLMPGDPLRAKYVAFKYLDNPMCFNDVRGMHGYTGTYKGVPVSVMGSGMGMPSIGIYSYELFSCYGVENIIRIGTCGAAGDDINIRDILLSEKAYSQSNYSELQYGFKGNCHDASENLNKVIIDTAKENNQKLILAPIASGDVFYMEDPTKMDVPFMKEVKGLEMESYALFSNAIVLKKNATCLLTVTDKHATGEALSSLEKETRLDEMFILALDSAIKY